MSEYEKLAERIENMLAQVGHPDYSLREMCDGLRDVVKQMRLAARQPSPSAREVVSEQRGFVEKPEVAWLIEFGGSGPRTAWWGRDRGYVGRWTENPNVAVRFARRQDAERACELLEISPPPIITEHVWFSRDYPYADTLANESAAAQATSDDKPMYRIRLPITARWTPRPDITAHELAVLLPYLLGKPMHEEDWAELGEATRHFSKSTMPGL